MAITAIEKYQGDSERIGGLRVLGVIQKRLSRTVGKTVDTCVVTHDSFHYFRDHSTLSPEDKVRIHTEVPRLVALAATGLIAVRRAFYVPSLENPPGPRHLGLKTPEQVISAIENVFTFAVTQGYDRETGSTIEAFFHPFIATVKFGAEIPESAILPRGGYAVPNDAQARSVRIIAVFGNNEGVQSLPGSDEYTVDIERLIITDKSVPQKEFAICTTHLSDAEKLKLPLRFQFEQVLSDLEILEAALVVRETSELMRHPQRVEFAFDGHEMYYNELFRYEIDDTQVEEIYREGEVLVINGPQDLRFVERGNSNQILFVGRKVVQKRDYGTLNAIASVKENLNILYPGTSATAHAMRVLVDAGHHAFVVGTKEFKNGSHVRISAKAGHATIEELSPAIDEKRNVVPLVEASLYSPELVGSKAYHLGKLMALGYRVPPGAVVTTRQADAERFLTSQEFTTFLGTLDSAKRYSVRSSANVEDGEVNAFVGQFHTEINVAMPDIPRAVQLVWRSAHRETVVSLLRDLGMQSAKMAVVIQEMIPPQFSGVIFGGNLEMKDKNQVVIEITRGLAAGVVDGTAEVTKVIFDKKTRRRLHVAGAQEKTGITDEQCQALLAMYMSLEEEFDAPQDVEWTIDRNADLHLLQTRVLIV